MDTVERPQQIESSTTYDGFISYSHAADDLLAPRLQAGLQRFAKPWWKRRALRIFRDESSLSANPHLWSSIVEALNESEWFVLLLSPDAARSEWVNQEIEHWTTYNDPTRILPVVTDGEFRWESGNVSGTAVPSALLGVFTEEPRWVDLRFAREEDDLDLKNPAFSNAVADVASSMRGVPKDELASEEVKQHRRTVRTAWAAGVVVLVLAITAVGFGIQSTNNARLAEASAAEAQRERDTAVAAESEAQSQARLAKARELAASSIAVQDTDPELATLLAIEAIYQGGNGADALFPEGLISLRQAVDSNQLVNRADFSGGGFIDVAFTADGSGIVITSPTRQQVALYGFENLEDPIWRYEDTTTNDLFIKTSVHPDGAELVVIVADDGADDGKPGRLVILDASTGEETQVVDTGECVEPAGYDGGEGLGVNGFSEGGTWFGLRVVATDCAEAPDVNDGIVYDSTTWNEAQRLSDLSGLHDGHISFTSDDAVALVHYTYATSELRSLPDFELLSTLDLTVGDRTPPWLARLSPDGGFIAGAMAPPDDNRAGFWSADDGTFLGWSDGYRGLARHLSFTGDGLALVAGTDTAVLYDPLTATRSLELHTAGATHGVDISRDGGLVVTSSLTGIVELWNLEPEGSRLAASVGWVNPNDIIEGDPMGLRAFGAEGGYSLFVFDSETGEVEGEFLTHAPSDGLPDGRFIVAEGGLGPEPDFEAGEEQESWLGPVVMWNPAQESTDLVRDCQVRWPGGTGDDKCPDGEPLFGTDLRAGPDGTELAGVSDGGLIRVWDAERLEIVRTVAPEIGNGLLQFNEGWFLTGADGDSLSAVPTLFAIDDESGEVLAEFEGSWRWHANAIARDGSRLYLMDQGGSVHEFDTADWELVRSWQAQQSKSRGIAVSPDGAKIATSGEDGLIWIWQVDSTNPILLDRIPATGDMVSDIVWLDDERMGAAIVLDWGHIVWQTIDLSSDAVVAKAVDGLVRGFGQSECDTYSIDPCPTLDEMRSR